MEPLDEWLRRPFLETEFARGSSRGWNGPGTAWNPPVIEK